MGLEALNLKPKEMDGGAWLACASKKVRPGETERLQHCWARLGSVSIVSLLVRFATE